MMALDKYRSCFYTIDGDAAMINIVPSWFDAEPIMADALSADDIRAAKLDREPWTNRVFSETRLAVALQVLRSIRDEQIGASSAVKALVAATLEAIE